MPSIRLAADQTTLADLANYSYIAHATEGGVALDEFPAVLAWLERIRELPHFSPMPSLAHPDRT